MPQVAQIIINIAAKAINKPFSYIIPSHLDFIKPGWRVLVPFGSRTAEGFVLAVEEIVCVDSNELKQIIDILDDFPWFNENMLKTANWISRYYFCTLSEALRLFIPGKSGIKSIAHFITATDVSSISKDNLISLSPDSVDIYNFIHLNNYTDLRTLTAKFGTAANKALHQLIKLQLITKATVVKKKNQTKYKSIIRLTANKTTVLNWLENNNNKRAQKKLLNLLLTTPELDIDDLKKNHNITNETVKKLLNTKLAEMEKKRCLRNSYTGFSGNYKKIVLSTDQQNAVSAVLPLLTQQKYHSFLLHGITGSGKTQVYIELTKKARILSRQVIVLVPEIALTSQIITRFRSYFNEDVVVLHSKLSLNERYDALHRLHSGEAGIVIGARSAAFAPLNNIGLIIIDEEHEFAYKQEEHPRYHTREVAFARARFANAVVLLGSATPAVETYYNALQHTHTLLAMPNRIECASLPEVQIVDMRTELAQGRRTVLSQALQQLLVNALSRKEQAILLLNRRGYATFVLCRECGHVLKCTNCSISLVYHSVSNSLRCHYCQHKQRTPDLCPSCGSRYIRYFGTGTQKLEQELADLFPDARILRMDQDTTHGKMSHHRIMSEFSHGKADILLGTQMVAKGHDIKNVTVVGILAADASLNLPDFRAGEKTFSLLTQAAGRAGRGTKPGQVVIQTYNPEHYSIATAMRQDYAAFYAREIEYRQELLYPPFSQLIKIAVSADDEQKLHLNANSISADLNASFKQLKDTMVLGPFPAPIYKINNLYRMLILIKTTEPDIMRKCMNSILRDTWIDAIIDVDPISLM